MRVRAKLTSYTSEDGTEFIEPGTVAIGTMFIVDTDTMQMGMLGYTNVPGSIKMRLTAWAKREGESDETGGRFPLELLDPVDADIAAFLIENPEALKYAESLENPTEIEKSAVVIAKEALRTKNHGFN